MCLVLALTDISFQVLSGHFIIQLSLIVEETFQMFHTFGHTGNIRCLLSLAIIGLG